MTMNLERTKQVANRRFNLLNSANDQTFTNSCRIFSVLKRFNMKTISTLKLSLIPLFGLVLFVLDGYGQGMVNDGAKIKMTSGTYVTITNGGFKNQTNGGNVGQVTNDQGTLTLDGDWQNEATSGVFGATPTVNTGGTVVMNGTTAVQDIQGGEETNFFNLTVAGTQEKRLDGVDANVYGQLFLNGTDLDLNTRTMTLEEPTTAALNNALFSGIISETAPSVGMGKLEWDIASTLGNYVIPFETVGDVPIPFTFNVTDAGTVSGSPDTYKRFATYPTNDQNTFVPGPSWTDLPPDVTHITNDAFVPNHANVVDRFWYIENDVQGFYPTNVPEISYTFTHDGGADVNGINTANLVAQRFNPDGTGNGTWLDWLYSPTAVGNTVTVNLGVDPVVSILDYYPAWTLVDNSDPLPIELVRFVGVCQEGSIELKWTTWTETNNDFFTLERSNNGTDFEVVDVIGGAGNSNEPITYTVVDPMPYGGTSYYRLKDTDYDGKSNYSDVIAVTCGTDGNDFNFVNAYDIDQSELMVEFTAADNEDFTIVLYDASGRLILDHNGSAYEGMNKVRLDVTNLARGIYIVNLSNGQRVYSKRVMLN